jgi:hypothetical protein
MPISKGGLEFVAISLRGFDDFFTEGIQAVFLLMK